MDGREGLESEMESGSRPSSAPVALSKAEMNEGPLRMPSPAPPLAQRGVALIAFLAPAAAPAPRRGLDRIVGFRIEVGPGAATCRAAGGTRFTSDLPVLVGADNRTPHPQQQRPEGRDRVRSRVRCIRLGVAARRSVRVNPQVHTWIIRLSLSSRLRDRHYA